MKNPKGPKRGTKPASAHTLAGSKNVSLRIRLIFKESFGGEKIDKGRKISLSDRNYDSFF